MSYDTLPRGYGVAADEPPEPKPQRCENCGHLDDDHNEPDSLTDDPGELLNALREIDKWFDKPGGIARVREALDKNLSVCQMHGCTCRKFEEER
jgi:hypothetical protein